MFCNACDHLTILEKKQPIKEGDHFIMSDKYCSVTGGYPNYPTCERFLFIAVDTNEPYKK